jgi:DNA-directed RNA polymerase I subunit RPA2
VVWGIAETAPQARTTLTLFSPAQRTPTPPHPPPHPGPAESLAGKAGALHGVFQDSTPFRFGDPGSHGREAPGDHYGEQLAAAGYCYYGTETMTSGVTGEPLAADIYLGVVYYQRLRHMVNDKAQVRSTGKVNALTRQPVKGRKKGGGIRFGEMERDSLLAHGASYLLHDRLMNVSDRHTALVCKACGGLLGAHSVPAAASEVVADGSVPGGLLSKPLAVASLADAGAAAAAGGAAAGSRVDRSRRVPVCRSCGTGAGVVPIALPYVFRYLANELAAMNVRLTLELGHGPYGQGRVPEAADGVGGRGSDETAAGGVD